MNHHSNTFKQVLIVTIASTISTAASHADTFTWQGKLVDGGLVADGVYDLQFSLWDAAGGGTQIDITLAADDVLVVDGLLTVDLDFTDPAAFDGSSRWLEINVKADADATYNTLTPRQPVHATPYATYAMSVADSAVPFSFSGVDGVFTGGNVGIGTAAPNALLHVNGAAGNGMSLNVENRLFVNQTDNFVGVGRASRLDASEIFGMHVDTLPGAQYGGMYASTNAGHRPFYGYAAGGSTMRTYYNGTTDAWHVDNGGELLTVAGNGNVGIGTMSPQAALDVQGGLITTGNVGIGTNAPERTLHVDAGNSGVTSNANADLVIEDDSTVWLNLLAPDASSSGILFGNPTGGSADGGVVYNGGTTPNGFEFRTNGNSTKMVIQGDGNIGIGTSAPERLMHVANGDAGVTPSSSAQLVVERDSAAYINLLTPDASSSGILFGSPTGGAANAGVVYNSGTSPNGLQFRTGGNGTRMVVQDNGNVGIGQNSPTEKLDISGDLRIVSNSDVGTGFGSGALHIEDSTGTLGLHLDANEVQSLGSDLLINFNNQTNTRINEVLHVRSDGRVGVNIASPLGVFHVGGTPGDGQVRLPNDSIGAQEIANETGIASALDTATAVPPDDATYSLISRVIDCPTSGYVLALGSAQVFPPGTLLDYEFEVAIAGAATNFPADNIYYGFLTNGLFSSFLIQKVYVVNAGQTEVFLNARNAENIRFKNIRLTLMFFPTAYGTVTP